MVVRRFSCTQCILQASLGPGSSAWHSSQQEAMALRLHPWCTHLAHVCFVPTLPDSFLCLGQQ